MSKRKVTLQTRTRDLIRQGVKKEELTSRLKVDDVSWRRRVDLGRRALVAAAIVLIAESSAAQPAADAFLLSFQRTLARGGRPAVVSMIRYPITISVVGNRIPFADVSALLDHYDAIFTPEVKAAVAATPSPLMKAADGFAIAGGLMTIQPVADGFKITRIEVHSLQPAEPARGGTPDRAASRVRETAQRIVLRAGRASERTGSLSPGRTDSYVVWVMQGQLLEARVDRVRARDIVLRIHDRTTSAPLDARARDGVRVWNGRVAASADYQIDVVRLVTNGEPDLSYWLSVAAR